MFFFESLWFNTTKKHQTSTKHMLNNSMASPILQISVFLSVTSTNLLHKTISKKMKHDQSISVSTKWGPPITRGWLGPHFHRLFHRLFHRFWWSSKILQKGTRPGERLHSNWTFTFCYGKISTIFFMGKSTISMAIFNCYVNVYQRVSYYIPWISHEYPIKSH